MVIWKIFKTFSLQVYKAKLRILKDASKDFYSRISELKNRPEALENLRRSLNLTMTFLNQVSIMKEKDEIFTIKDVEDAWKILNETVVSIDQNARLMFV